MSGHHTLTRHTERSRTQRKPDPDDMSAAILKSSVLMERRSSLLKKDTVPPIKLYFEGKTMKEQTKGQTHFFN